MSLRRVLVLLLQGLLFQMVFLGFVFAFAQSTLDTAKDYSKEKLSQVQQAHEAIPLNRAAKNYTVAVNTALFELWVITKFGISLTYNHSSEDVFDFEYMDGSLGFGYFGMDLGSIREQKVSALWRSYGSRKTLSFFTGLTYNNFKVHLGNEYLETVSGSERMNVDVTEIATLGATFGFGQRWHTENGFVWGVDWLNITVPFLVLQDRTPFTEASNSYRRREELSDAAKLFKRMPGIGVLKFQLGFSF